MTINRKIGPCPYFCPLVFLLIWANPGRLPAGLYGDTYRQLREEYSGNELIFDVGKVAIDPSRSNMVMIITVEGELIHLRKDIY